MRKVIAMLLAFWFLFAPLPLAPYVSCPGGYIVKSYDQCPPIKKPTTIYPGHGSGGSNVVGGGGGGILGGLLGGLL